MYQVDDIRTSVIQGIKEIINSNSEYALTDFDDGIHDADYAEMFSNSVLAKNIKEYIEKVLLNQVECKLSEVPDIQKMTWKIDAHNIAKDVLDSPKVFSIKQNLDNIVETCVKQICIELGSGLVLEKTKELQIYFPLADNSIQHIQSKFGELTQFISSTKPVNIRIKAYELLISSHYADTITKSNWTELQHSFQESLNDNNMDVFKLCLKLHAKLLSSSSYEMVKDVFLNLLESLCRHYNEQNSEFESMSFSNNTHFRMVSIVNLIINAINAITQNIARFGLKRLEEIIDNLIHLMSMHKGTKSIKRKHFLSPFEIMSCLDPMGSWCMYLTHGVVSRNIFLNPSGNSLRNNSLLQLIVEELIAFFSKPFIPDELHVELNEISIPHVKYGVFIHSLSLFSTICQYEMGRAFFPLLINKNEECVTIPVVTEKVILFLNERIEKEKELDRTFSSSFIDLVVNCAKTLFSIKENQTTLLQVVIKPLQQMPPKLFFHTIEMLDAINHCECDKHLFIKHSTSGRKRGTPLNKVTASVSCLRNKHYKSPSEQQNVFHTSLENNSTTCIIDILVDTLTLLLRNKDLNCPTDLVCQLISVLGKYLLQHDGLCSVLTKENKSEVIQTLAMIYKNKFDNEDNFESMSSIHDSNLIR